jgi:hypothetical protein
MLSGMENKLHGRKATLVQRGAVQKENRALKMSMSKDIEIEKNTYEYTAQKKDGKEIRSRFYLSSYIRVCILHCTVYMCLEAGLEL